MKDTDDQRLWVTIPEAGAIMYGLSPAASYRAAKRGEIPALPVGNRYVVPISKMRVMMGLEPEPIELPVRVG